MIKAIIIDDEKLARDIIKAYLKKHESAEVLAECQDGFEGVKLIMELKPDLIFLDVQMPKLTGFEMLELLDETPNVIFSTAFDQYAIKAFELSATDYLLKPYSQQRFDEALQKVISKIDNKEPNSSRELVKVTREVEESIDRIVIRNGSKIVILGIDDIQYFEAQDDYVNIHTEEKKYLKQMTMKYLESNLPNDQFARVHRSYIASISAINKLEPYSKDSYVAILKDGTKIPVSRNGFQALKSVLKF